MPEQKAWVRKTATVVSVLFHPVFIPLYGLLIIYSAPTLLSYIPFQMKRIVLLMVLLNNVILPLSIAMILYARGALKTIYARERHERLILLTFSLLLYAITAFLLVRIPVPSLFKAYFISIAAVTLAALIISFFTRISLHATGMGGLLALPCFIMFLFDIVSIEYLTSLVFLTGVVMSSRLYLSEHKPVEVWFGLLAGAGVMSLSLFLLLR